MLASASLPSSKGQISSTVLPVSVMLPLSGPAPNSKVRRFQPSVSSSQNQRPVLYPPSPSLTSFTNTLCFTLCFTRMDMRRRPFMSTSPSGRAALQCSLSHPPGLAASVIFRHLLPSCSTTVGVARSQKPPSLPSSLSSPFQITVWADAERAATVVAKKSNDFFIAF